MPISNDAFCKGIGNYNRKNSKNILSQKQSQALLDRMAAEPGDRVKNARAHCMLQSLLLISNVAGSGNIPFATRKSDSETIASNLNREHYNLMKERFRHAGNQIEREAGIYNGTGQYSGASVNAMPDDRLPRLARRFDAFLPSYPLNAQASIESAALNKPKALASAQNISAQKMSIGLSRLSLENSLWTPVESSRVSTNGRAKRYAVFHRKTTTTVAPDDVKIEKLFGDPFQGILFKEKISNLKNYAFERNIIELG